MHADLKWLAKNVIEWGGGERFNYIYLLGDDLVSYCAESVAHIGEKTFTHNDFLAAQDELKDPFSSPDEDEAWQAAEKRMDIIGHNGATGEHYEKQERYKDDQGKDWIDEAARTLTAEEFRGAMRFTIGKYNRRMGKKDELINEIEKMRDYCSRWLEVEQGR